MHHPEGRKTGINARTGESDWTDSSNARGMTTQPAAYSAATELAWGKTTARRRERQAVTVYTLSWELNSFLSLPTPFSSFTDNESRKAYDTTTASRLGGGGDGDGVHTWSAPYCCPRP